MKPRAAPPMALLLAVLAVLPAAPAWAARAYVSDELVLGVYAELNNQGRRLTTLHSGASLETLGNSGDFTQVALSDGTKGWVKSAYLTSQEPATVRVKRLQEELDRAHATTPALADAAQRSEIQGLRRELAAQQAAGAAARTTPPSTQAAPGVHAPPGAALALLALLAALLAGFWLGYATLAHRVRRKFGGLKVY